MEKLKITKVGTPKKVNTKFGEKVKTGVIFETYPNIWHDVWADNLKEGQILEGERVSREWEGKIYWSFTFPKKSEVAVQAVKDVDHRLQGIEITLGWIKSFLQLNIPKRTSDGNLMPHFGDEQRAYIHANDQKIVQTSDENDILKSHEESEINVDEIPF